MNEKNVWIDYLRTCSSANVQIDFHPESYPQSRPDDVGRAVLEILRSASGLKIPFMNKTGIKSIKFICGKGTGTLRRHIESILSGSDLIHSYRQCDGGGSFIVKLAWPFAGSKALKNLSRLDNLEIRKSVSHDQLSKARIILNRILNDYGIRTPYRLVLNLCKTALDNSQLIDKTVTDRIRSITPRLAWAEFRGLDKPTEIKRNYLCLFVKTAGIGDKWHKACKKAMEASQFRIFTGKLEKHLKNRDLI